MTAAAQQALPNPPLQTFVAQHYQERNHQALGGRLIARRPEATGGQRVRVGHGLGACSTTLPDRVMSPCSTFSTAAEFSDTTGLYSGPNAPEPRC